MFENLFSDLENTNCSITTIPKWIVVMLLLFTISCKHEVKETVAVTFNPDSTYTMKALDVLSLISDSGVTRYRMKAKEWLVYDKASEPYWYFPQTIYVEKFDTLYNPEASVQADTAYFYTKQSLWKLIGNVHVENLQGEKFDTQLLYWDQKKEIIYSDSFIRIEPRKDEVITGYGFESNQDLSYYKTLNSSAAFVVDEKEKTKDSVTVVEKKKKPQDFESLDPDRMMKTLTSDKPIRPVKTYENSKQRVKALNKEDEIIDNNSIQSVSTIKKAFHNSKQVKR